MLYYDKSDISQTIEPAKSNSSKECMICHYWLFNHGLCLNISDIAIITFKNVDFCCIVHDINKSEAINLLKNSVLEHHWYI